MKNDIREWSNEYTEKEQNLNQRMKNEISGNEGMNKQKKNEIKIGKWRMKYLRMKEWIYRKRTK